MSEYINHSHMTPTANPVSPLTGDFQRTVLQQLKSYDFHQPSTGGEAWVGGGAVLQDVAFQCGIPLS
jgi:hypothetical protein